MQFICPRKTFPNFEKFVFYVDFPLEGHPEQMRWMNNSTVQFAASPTWVS